MLSSVSCDGNGDSLTIADAVVCVDGSRLAEDVNDGGDGGDMADGSISQR